MIKIEEKTNYQQRIDKVIKEEKEKRHNLFDWELEIPEEDGKHIDSEGNKYNIYYCVYRMPTSQEFKEIKKKASLFNSGKLQDFDNEDILQNCCIFPTFQEMQRFEEAHLGTFDELVKEIISKTSLNAVSRSKKL
jgi:hypothetical protein